MSRTGKGHIMILDSSAVVTLLLRHPGYEEVFEVLAGADVLGMGAPTLTETGVVLGARLSLDPSPLLGRFVQEYGVEVIPFGESHWWEAMEAFQRFGKGRHRAGLNFGDCLTYAIARLAHEPLLFVGDDFPHTDLDLVPLGIR